MRNEVFGTCPVCGHQLLATRLTCSCCHTEITGEFALSRFSYLNRDELQFVDTFIRVQGNIKEMEKEFNISYPTVKKMLESIIQKMGFSSAQKEEPAADAEDILTQLQQGRISADEAIALLKK